jgi:hypothetical protein
MGRLLVKLVKPVQLGEEGVPVTELSFRDEVVAGDMRGIKLSALSDPTPDDMLKIAGRLCGQPDALMSRLCLADLLKVVEVVGGFLEAGLAIGSAASPS